MHEVVGGSLRGGTHCRRAPSVPWPFSFTPHGKRFLYNLPGVSAWASASSPDTASGATQPPTQTSPKLLVQRSGKWC